MRHPVFVIFLLLAGLLVGLPVHAGLPAFQLTIENGRFIPEVIEVPARTRFKLVITNKGPGPEEFESKKLRKETVLAPGVTRSLVFAPLKPGSYRFFGEFHPDTAQGRIVAK
ncbi:MAG TPA: cupredoxin domain-containing protein [Chromatiales bacterium]|nr:cupredoxin domain-containing protein [Chromatiales bacterium]HEX22123.1 cupredoxin domain-containing protein [Chromatiales bacterium]